jgi:hypothetical protein
LNELNSARGKVAAIHKRGWVYVKNWKNAVADAAAYFDGSNIRLSN